MAKDVIAVLGGGTYTPELCRLLAERLADRTLHIRLAARRPERLATIAGHAAKLVRSRRPDWRVEAVPSNEAAIRGASIVVLLVRVGGLRARAWDETFPTRHGLVGDEGLGAGGAANAWRTVPVVDTLAEQIARHAPGARVLNLMAPLGVTTRRLIERGLDAVGVCELPLVTRERLVAGHREQRAHDSTASLRYAGLNHLGWFWPADKAGREILEDGVRVGVVHGPTLERFGGAPLHYYYQLYSREAARSLGCDKSRGRAQHLMRLADAMLAGFRDASTSGADDHKRETPWFDRALVPIVDALLDGPTHHGFINLRNDGTLPELPAEIVVEVEADIDARGSHARRPGRMPAPVAEFLSSVGAAEAVLHEAAVARDERTLAAAMAALLPGIEGSVAEDLARLARRPIEAAESSPTKPATAASRGAAEGSGP